jgi:cyclase
MERLAEGVYAIIHDDSTKDWDTGGTDWPHGNTAVVIGGDSVLVVDTTFLPARAAADIALIRRVTDKPVRFLVNTHWHGDHTHGNGVYKKAYPSLSVIGAVENREYIARNLVRAPAAMLGPQSGLRKTLADLEAKLADQTMPAARRSALESNIAARRHEIAELAKVEVVAPDVLFEESLTLILGERKVEIRNRGRANSPADTTVYLPAEQILVTGDILVHPVPYAMQSHPTSWAETLRILEATPVKAIVPGHGPVMRDHAYTRQVRELVETAMARVSEKMQQGVNNEQVQVQIRMDDIRPRFVAPSDAGGIAIWEHSIQKALLERAWACLVGYRC